jgi:predicted Zn-dependent protease
MGMDRRRLLLGLSAAGLAAALPAAAQFNKNDRIQSDTMGVLGLDDEDEFQIGAVVYRKAIAEYGGPLPNQRAQDALRRMLRPMFAVADRGDVPWEVTLVNNFTELNAFAGPGGKVTVLPSLISICDSQGEFASVMAHEIGHVDRRHWRSKMDVSALGTAMGIGSGGLTGRAGADSTLSPQAVADIEAAFKKYLKVGFTRIEEEEADAHIAVIFDRLGLDIRPAANLFIKFGKAGGNWETTLGNDHPGSIERARAILERAAFMGPRQSKEPELPGWKELKSFFPTPPEFRNA